MKLLFVCTGNTCRSPMAKALAQDWADKKGLDIQTRSRGIYAFEGSPLSKGARGALEELGIDLSNHRSSLLTKEDLDWADRVYTMTRAQTAEIRAAYPDLGGKVDALDYNDIPDPFAGSQEEYNRARDLIIEALKKREEDLR